MSQSRYTIGINSGEDMNATMKAREAKALEKLERRQQGEIEKMIEYELRQTEFKQKAEEKEEKAAEREAERLKDLAIKHEQQEKRRQKEEMRKLKQLQDE